MYTPAVARLLGIDIGTSGTKALLVDETGKVLASAEAAYPLSTPRPGWAEQDPEDWWRAVQSCIAQIGVKPDAIGLTGQMHGSVFLDGDENVVRPALLWCDQRTQAEVGQIEEIVGHDRIRQITCNPPLTGFQAPKALWLRENEAENFSKTEKVLLPKDFIVRRLAGVFTSDVSDASGTGLLDVRARQWSGEVLSSLGLDRGLFPEVVESSTIVGHTREGVPVVAGAGDQAAGAVGVGAVVPGVVSVSLGTSGVVFTSVQQPEPNETGSVHVFCHANRSWHAMGVMLSCGGALRWVRDTLFPGSSYDEMATMAKQAPVGSEGLFFQPTLAGERCPFVDPQATGAFAGLTLAHGRGHIARSVFEGVSFGIGQCLGAVTQNSGRPEKLRVTGGGARSRFWLQMLSDVTGTTCVTMESDDGPAFGAALLAGVGVGIWKDVVEATRETVRERDRFDPSGTRYENAMEQYKRLYPVLKDWAASPFGLK